ncbi:hypothetical protein [Bacillus badius]|uniref:hypothetical protein n=1 Tax=Bacillus badius TaxID=1455 RepID=UPI0005ADA3FE|nr:hypothetical protein [Bacillus badius]KIL74350.1 hypothetical protein SD78_1419 [Bacillus badius]
MAKANEEFSIKKLLNKNEPLLAEEKASVLEERNNVMRELDNAIFSKLFGSLRF